MKSTTDFNTQGFRTIPAANVNSAQNACMTKVNMGGAEQINCKPGDSAVRARLIPV